MVAMDVKKQGLFWLIKVENAELVQQKDGLMSLKTQP
jgi:hypothetical protein